MGRLVFALLCVRDRSGYETLNQLRIANYELRIANYELRITSYELPVTNYGKGGAERQDQPYVCGE